MALKRGEFTLSKKNEPLVEVNGKKLHPARGEVSQTLLDRLAEFVGHDVEFELVQDKPKQIREPDGSFVPPSQETPKYNPAPDLEARNAPRARGDFHNPYNFVPAPPRNTRDSELGDQIPVAQDAFLPDRYTGSIRVRMTAKTPLLVPDTERMEENDDGHKTYPLRVDTHGKPSIPASSARGMLRCAYETITHSRFGRFSESHKKTLEYRRNEPPFDRVPYHDAPSDLLDKSLHPAATIDQLSPADRVFGWVKGDADTETRSKGERVAARGLLRVGALQCDSSAADAAETFDKPGVALAILSAPKPQQGRFYVAASANGEAQADGRSKVDAGYSSGKGLRGRKVFPHQRLPEAHWHNPTEDNTQQEPEESTHYQEYRRPRTNDGRKRRDDQNRSILGWVKPGAQFTFDLHVHNLSEVELGALLWLLDLPEEHFLRFGGGKPLGFGSVRLKVESCALRTGKALRARYEQWCDACSASDPRETAVEAFTAAMKRAYPNTGSGDFVQLPFIAAFLTACRGHADALPTHYPRATADGRPGPPNPAGKSFEWFVANEKQGARYALPDLDDDGGLPTLPPAR